MNKEVVSDRQGIFLVILFVIGSGSVTVPGLEAKQDVWLASILGIVLSLPMVFIYARLQYIFPDKDLYDIIQICFGRFLGNLVIIFFVLHLIAIQGTIIRHHGEFITVVGLIDTPIIIIIFLFSGVVAYASKKGIEVLGRWGELFIKVVIPLTVIMLILFIPDMNINNIKPMLAKGIKPLALGSFKILVFPFSQIVVFSAVFSSFRKRKSPYNIYLKGFLISALIMFATSLSVILVLGVNQAGSKYFSTHAAVTRINIMSMQRVEVLSSILFLLGGFVKMGIHLIAICIGISKIFRLRDYRILVIPVAAQLVNLTYLTWYGTMDFFEFDRDAMPYISFLNRVIIPIVVLIFAEIKKKKLTDIST
ncbi:GerAB/ArcD/ProY family transporter [Wukongibacter baidiensis]